MKGLIVALGVAVGLIGFSGAASAQHRHHGHSHGHSHGHHHHGHHHHHHGHYHGGIYTSPYVYGGFPAYSGYRSLGYSSPGYGYGYPRSGYVYPGASYGYPGYGYGYPSYGAVNFAIYRPGFSLGFAIPIR